MPCQNVVVSGIANPICDHAHGDWGKQKVTFGFLLPHSGRRGRRYDNSPEEDRRLSRRAAYKSSSRSLPVIGTGTVENMRGGDPVTVGRGVLHFTMTDIRKNDPAST